MALLPAHSQHSDKSRGVAVASWIFKKAYDAMLVRREIADSVWAKMLRPWRIALVWLA
jgi:hypothetical protein